MGFRKGNNSLTIHELITGVVDNKYTINIRGTNGTGKTTLARGFIEADKNAEEIFIKGMKKPAFVYCHEQNVLIVGHYRNKCGGCDTMVKKDIIRLIKLAWLTDCNVLFEGVLVSDSKVPYYEYMRDLHEQCVNRNWGFAYLMMDFDKCLKRVYQRNGGKPVKEHQIKQKWKSSYRYMQWHQEQGDCVVLTLDAIKSIQAVRTDFLVLLQFVNNGDRIIKVQGESYLTPF